MHFSRLPLTQLKVLAIKEIVFEDSHTISVGCLYFVQDVLINELMIKMSLVSSTPLSIIPWKL